MHRPLFWMDGKKKCKAPCAREVGTRALGP